jgi:hypothetical protein
MLIEAKRRDDLLSEREAGIPKKDIDSILSLDYLIVDFFRDGEVEHAAERQGRR